MYVQTYILLIYILKNVNGPCITGQLYKYEALKKRKKEVVGTSYLYVPICKFCQFSEANPESEKPQWAIHGTYTIITKWEADDHNISSESSETVRSLTYHESLSPHCLRKSDRQRKSKKRMLIRKHIKSGYFLHLNNSVWCRWSPCCQYLSIHGKP